jgi:hypothetical protein
VCCGLAVGVEVTSKTSRTCRFCAPGLGQPANLRPIEITPAFGHWALDLGPPASMPAPGRSNWVSRPTRRSDVAQLSRRWMGKPIDDR